MTLANAISYMDAHSGGNYRIEKNVSSESQEYSRHRGYDTDNDGNITLSEYLEGRSKANLSYPRPSARDKKIAKNIDLLLNGSGLKRTILGKMQNFSIVFLEPVRGAAARALGEIGDKNAIPALIEALSRDPNSIVRILVIYALEKIRGKSIAPVLISTLRKDRDSGVRDAAARVLGGMRERSAVPVLVDALRKESIPGVRDTIVKALGGIRDKRAFTILKRALTKDPSSKVRQAAAIALGKIGEGKAVPFLVKAVGDSSKGVQHAAAIALGEFFSAYARQFPALVISKIAKAMVFDFCDTLYWGGKKTKKFFASFSSILQNFPKKKRFHFIHYALPKIRKHVFKLMGINNFDSAREALQWVASLDRNSFPVQYRSLIDRARGLVKRDPLFVIQTKSKQSIRIQRFLTYAPKTTARKLSSGLIAELYRYRWGYRPSVSQRGLKKYVQDYVKGLPGRLTLRFLGIKDIRHLNPFQAAVLSTAIVQYYLRNPGTTAAEANQADRIQSIAELLRYGHGVCRHFVRAASAVFMVLKSMQNRRNSKLVNSYLVSIAVTNKCLKWKGNSVTCANSHVVNLLLTQSSPGVWEAAAIEPQGFNQKTSVYRDLFSGAHDTLMHLIKLLLQEEKISVHEAIRMNKAFLNQCRDPKNIAFAKFSAFEYHLIRLRRIIIDMRRSMYYGFNYSKKSDLIKIVGEINELQKGMRKEIGLAKEKLESFQKDVLLYKYARILYENDLKTAQEIEQKAVVYKRHLPKCLKAIYHFTRMKQYVDKLQNLPLDIGKSHSYLKAIKTEFDGAQREAGLAREWLKQVSKESTLYDQAKTLHGHIQRTARRAINLSRYKIAEYHLLRIRRGLGWGGSPADIAEKLLEDLREITSYDVRYLNKLKIIKLRDFEREIRLAQEQLKLIPKESDLYDRAQKTLIDIQGMEKAYVKTNRLRKKLQIGLGINSGIEILGLLNNRGGNQLKFGINLGLHIEDFKILYQHSYGDNSFGCPVSERDEDWRCKDSFSFHSDGIIANYSFYYLLKGTMVPFVSAGLSYLYNSSNSGLGWEAGIGLDINPYFARSWLRFHMTPEVKYSGLKFGNKGLHSLGGGVRIGFEFDFTKR